MADLTRAFAQIFNANAKLTRDYAEIYATGLVQMPDPDRKPGEPRPLDAGFDPNQPRDERGEWTEIGGGHESQKLIDAINNAGGFTYQPLTKDMPKAGDEAFAVSPYPNLERVIDRATLSKRDLANFVRRNKKILEQRDHYFGGWFNPENGKVYLDVSRVTRSRSVAERLAREHKQIAYFDFKTMEAVNVQGVSNHGKAKAAPRYGPRHRQRG